MRKLLNFIALIILSIPVTAQDIPLAHIVTDEGGVAFINGQVTYTNAFFTTGVSDPVILLEDQAGFAARDDNFIIPLQSQTMGYITSSFQQSPFTYTLNLPGIPKGTLVDISDSDATRDDVMVFAISYWSNMFGNSYLEQRDMLSVGWRRSYSSTNTSADAATEGEYIGGKIIVYVPSDDPQAFPSGFGADNRLFTSDDPLVLLPSGYTLVDMDTDPFTFDRSQTVTVDLIEGDVSAADDFSRLGYSDAFVAMVDKFRREYAFTEYKGIDWSALEAEFLPRFVEAENNNDLTAYFIALRDFTWRIPDDHIDSNLVAALATTYFQETEGGIGLSIRQMDTGAVIAHFVGDNMPADQAGIVPGAEIISVDGMPITDHVEQAATWGGPYSTPHVEYLQKLRYAMRFPVSSTVQITFKNPDDTTSQTVGLTTIAEDESFLFSSFNRTKTGFELPVMWQPVGDDYLYVVINDFLDDRRLTIQLWERMLTDANNNRINGLIIDMRNNGGGSGWLADQMAAYFFDTPHKLGMKGFYDDASASFVFDPDDTEYFILPPEHLRYAGDVVVLIGPNCASACEFFSYNMTIENRAEIVGQYPSSGMGGSVERFFMPHGIVLQMTTGRAVDLNGDIHIEGRGVEPTINVPVTVETLLSNEDAVLSAALDYLKRK